MDMDDHGIVLPPPEWRKVIVVTSGSGFSMTDVLFNDFEPKSNHPRGGFFGARACGENFRALLEMHPAYLDPMSSLAGGHMVNFLSYRNPQWNPDFDFAHLREETDRYKLASGDRGGPAFLPGHDHRIRAGMGGACSKRSAYYRTVNTDEEARSCTTGWSIASWACRTGSGAHAAAAQGDGGSGGAPATPGQPARDRRDQRAAGDRAAEDLPRGVPVDALVPDGRQDVQHAAARWAGSTSSSTPYYERDSAAGILTDEEAMFHIACHFLMDTSYTQLGGPDAEGSDTTNRLSYLILEAAHRLRIPANIGVCVGRECRPRACCGAASRSCSRTRPGSRSSSGSTGPARDSPGTATRSSWDASGPTPAATGARSPAGSTRSTTASRSTSAAVFDVALREMMADPAVQPRIEDLWERFDKHLRRAVEVIAESLEFHMDHMYRGLPGAGTGPALPRPDREGQGRLPRRGRVLQPLRRRRGAGHRGRLLRRARAAGRAGGAADLGRDAPAAWTPTGRAPRRAARLMMKSDPALRLRRLAGGRVGHAISQAFTGLVKEKPTPHGFNMIPGLFSWAAHILMGKDVGATPNGRHAQAPISHGANPDPGFRERRRADGDGGGDRRGAAGLRQHGAHAARA